MLLGSERTCTQHFNAHSMKRISIVALALLSFNQLQAQFIVNNGISITNTSNVITNGDWVNDAGTAIRNDGIISTSETFTNNGTLDPASTGGFVLNFATNKTFTPGGTSFGFLTKEGAGNATIVGQFTVRDSLSLQGGLITPSTATDVVTVAETGIVISVPGSFVDGGNLVRNGTGDLFFPVGKDGIELPITFLNVRGTNPSVTVEVVDAPGGFTAGPGIDALIAFPYAWSTTKANVADTANYVEVQYPNSLPNAANAIVTRKAGAASYEGMGARIYSDVAGTVRIRSYSRGLQGLFSVATGFAGNLETDSLALVDFYNATGAAAWTKDTNWLTGTIGTWQGVTETGGAITALALDNANIVGAMNSEVADILSLRSVNVAGNNLTAVPDFSSLPMTSLNLSNNNLDFASLEGNATLGGSVVSYSNQRPIDLQLGDSVLVDAGTDYNFTATVGGTQNSYAFSLNDVSAATNTTGILPIPAINRSNMGTYEVAITNTLVPGLTLSTIPVSILGVADVSGRVTINATDPATAGSMNLFRITSTGGYDTVQVKSLASDGSYLFNDVILDDYIILAKPSTTLYPLVIPTYYSSTIFWEEASEVAVDANVPDLNIQAQFVPVDAPTGTGSLAGILEEDDGTGRVEKTRRVGGAGATARRAQGSGRGEETVYVVVAYVETNEDGEFEMPDLPNGQYRLNIQYPGYPMDESSFVEFVISATNPLAKDVKVEAVVVDGKITVRELVITGLYEADDYSVTVHPNPAVESIHFTFENNSAQRELLLQDASGKMLKQQTATNKQGSMTVRELPSGTYLLQVRDQNNVKKIIRVVIE